MSEVPLPRQSPLTKSSCQLAWNPNLWLVLSTSGRVVRVSCPGQGRYVVFVYKTLKDGAYFC